MLQLHQNYMSEQDASDLSGVWLCVVRIYLNVRWLGREMDYFIKAQPPATQNSVWVMGSLDLETHT